MFLSWFRLRWRLSPLFYEDAQILFFRPHKLFREGIRQLLVLVGTVLQLRFAVQGFGKKDVEEG